MKAEANQIASTRIKICRVTYSILALVLFICIVVQVYLAGMALFGNPEAWAWHRTFVHLFEYISIVLFILGIVGKLPKRMVWGSLGLFLLFNIQYYTAHGIAGALHPVLVLVVFGVALALVRSSYPFLTKRG